jgi:hypothetical protein
MIRAALFTLLVASVLNEPLRVHAQRATASFHGGSSARLSGRSGFAGRRVYPSRVFPNRYFSSRSHMQHDGFGSGFFPYDEPFDYAQTDVDAETEGTAPPLVILRPDERPSREPEPPAAKPLVIEVPAEIPGAANSRETKILPPTIFILEDGERVETRRFLLTASVLSFSVDRQQRVVPFDMLDIDATLSANHERGIDLRIPVDRNEISLSF